MRNMSFSLTTAQMYLGTKTVTRRQGWAHLRPSDKVMAVEKGMGLQKGETIRRIRPILITSIHEERVMDIIHERDATALEGFPGMPPVQFIEMYCAANKCLPDSICRRIEFEPLTPFYVFYAVTTVKLFTVWEERPALMGHGTFKVIMELAEPYARENGASEEALRVINTYNYYRHEKA